MIHGLWLWRYVSTANLFCKIFDFVTNISGRLWSFSRLMARANQSPANPISYVFFVVWKDCVITDTVPSINKCAEHNKITEYFMWWPVCPVDSIYPRLSLLHILGEDKKKLDTVLFSSTVCFADLSTCKQRNAYYHFVLKNVAVRKRLHR